MAQSELKYFERVDRTDLPEGAQAYKVVNIKKIRDEQTIQAFGVELQGITEKAAGDKAKHFVLDMSDVEYLSSAALGKFIAANKTLGQSCKLHVVGCKREGSEKPPLEMFEITRLNRVFEAKQCSLDAWIQDQNQVFHSH